MAVTHILELYAHREESVKSQERKYNSNRVVPTYPSVQSWMPLSAYQHSISTMNHRRPVAPLSRIDSIGGLVKEHALQSWIHTSRRVWIPAEFWADWFQNVSFLKLFIAPLRPTAMRARSP